MKDVLKGLLVVCLVGLVSGILFVIIWRFYFEHKATSQPLYSGGYNVAIGKDAAKNLTTGSYNFCIGDGTCPDLTTQDCVIDFRPQGPVYEKLFPGGYQFEPVYEQELVEQHKVHCGLDNTNEMLLDLIQLSVQGINYKLERAQMTGGK